MTSDEQDTAVQRTLLRKDYGVKHVRGYSNAWGRCALSVSDRRETRGMCSMFVRLIQGAFFRVERPCLPHSFASTRPRRAHPHVRSYHMSYTTNLPASRLLRDSLQFYLYITNLVLVCLSALSCTVLIIG